MKDVLGCVVVAFLTACGMMFYNSDVDFSNGLDNFFEEAQAGFANEEEKYIYNTITIIKKDGRTYDKNHERFTVSVKYSNDVSRSIVYGNSEKIMVYYDIDRFNSIIGEIPVELCHQINTIDVAAHSRIFLGFVKNGSIPSKQFSGKRCEVTKFGSEQVSIVEMGSSRFLMINSLFYKDGNYQIRVG